MASGPRRHVDILALGFARLGGIGAIPRAPGTWASLAAICLAPFIFLPLPLFPRFLFLAAIYIPGVLACARAEEILGEKDPPQVVIDEFFGQLLVCLPFAGLETEYLAAAFILFRVFDIAKPWPVSAAEKAPGGTGIMLDDLVAALYAMICLAALRWATGRP
ncbi:MAG: phosphatidylglycerophosphatase A [Desulfovibrio sp.]|jgi:phosphatidylglycerophosphatase A|nr:phosphatidylglycerophosphatase A [Desulfovibrio sp.]